MGQKNPTYTAIHPREHNQFFPTATFVSFPSHICKKHGKWAVQMERLKKEEVFYYHAEDEVLVKRLGEDTLLWVEV